MPRYLTSVNEKTQYIDLETLTSVIAMIQVRDRVGGRILSVDSMDIIRMGRYKSDACCMSRAKLVS